mgnify:CR=1 FL=1
MIKKSSLHKRKSAGFYPMTQDELVKHIKESEDDFKNGRVISHAEMKKGRK